LPWAQLWPANGFTQAQGQSLALLWCDVLRSFVAHCRSVFSTVGQAGSSAQAQANFPRAKLLLLIQRMLLEDRVSGDFLFRCDASTFQLSAHVPASPTGASPKTPQTPSQSPFNREAL